MPQCHTLVSVRISLWTAIFASFDNIVHLRLLLFKSQLLVGHCKVPKNCWNPKLVRSYSQYLKRQVQIRNMFVPRSQLISTTDDKKLSGNICWFATAQNRRGKPIWLDWIIHMGAEIIGLLRAVGQNSAFMHLRAAAVIWLLTRLLFTNTQRLIYNSAVPSNTPDTTVVGESLGTLLLRFYRFGLH